METLSVVPVMRVAQPVEVRRTDDRTNTFQSFMEILFYAIPWSVVFPNALRVARSGKTI